ncbi:REPRODUCTIVE MERISTEM 39, REDUCED VERNALIZATION RESPONSE 1 [Hibiscus trionum]|uniref:REPRODUCTIVE MERISTEM 39, REDUCED VERNALIZATION RESPONSE 1 n=1 Tax=Hibiscus trionum TaxID=183268 RepID=A0A9W7IJW4_HIBTR|nr:REPRODUCTIVE MERISTEM 39, REDUCED VERNALIZATION RESPONSE 1 [Hibiscus trionum]
MAREATPGDMPGFFKVLVGDFSKRLRIPPAFAKFFHRTPLPHEVKLQNSEEQCWQVNVVKINNKLFLNKGWKSFVKDNLLEIGDFVFFSYVRRSLFAITVFESNGCVKHVTGKKKQSEATAKNVSDKKRPVVIKIEDTDDEDNDISVEILENVTKVGEKRKRTEFKQSGPAVPDSPKPREGSGNKNVQALKGKEKSLVIERAKSAFKSENPFFMVTIQPSYIGVGHNVNIPLDFVLTHFNQKCKNVILEVPPGDKTWHVKYYVNVSAKRYVQAKLHSRWLDFANENHLAVGDVCVFELINTAQNILRVCIFRLNM